MNFGYLAAVVVLGGIILFHEFGHYLLARLNGVAVVEFSVGFGPKILGWKHKGTQFSLRAIPLGGFCKFVGEDENNSAPDAMNNASVWKRILTVFAGPAMNFVLAFLTGIVVLCMFSTADVYPEIRQVVDASAAQEAGLLPGDEITAVNGEAIAHNASGTQALREAVQTRKLRAEQMQKRRRRTGTCWEVSGAPSRPGLLHHCLRSISICR